MSSTTTRLPLRQAQALYEELAALLRPACIHLEAAGSLRRQRPTVGDLELVAIPALAQSTDLWGEPHGAPLNLLHHATDELRARPDRPRRAHTALGAALPPLPLPRRRRRSLPRHTQHLGVIYPIRTGSAAFSKRCVTPRQHGGWLPLGYQVRDGVLSEGNRVVPTPTEEDVFEIVVEVPNTTPSGSGT